MIVKFHARGVGRGSGPVDYLLGPQRDREGATLDRGDPGLIEALIDSRGRFRIRNLKYGKRLARWSRSQTIVFERLQ